MITNIAPTSVLLCGVLGLAVSCLAILRMAILEHRQRAGRRRVRPVVQIADRRQQERDSIAA